MLSILGFLLLLGILGGGVWFAVSHEDLVTGPEKSRLGALSRALQRVRRGRASRPAATSDQPADHPVVSTSAQASVEAPLPPAP